jgi:hypothetical protein
MNYMHGYPGERELLATSSERGVYGLTWIFTPLSTYDSVVSYAHSVDA